ncbi:MAG: LiaF domain-containing protein [Bacteroidota bacterium]
MTEREERREERRNRRRWGRDADDDGRGRAWTGVLFLVIGGVALLKSFRYPIPDYIFNWQALLVTIGLFTGFKHNFRGGAWFIMILVGTAFWLNEFVFKGDLDKHEWPIILIGMGLFFIFRPHRRSLRKEWDIKKKTDQWSTEITGEETFIKEDFIDATSIFGSTKKNILSKNFKGGDITNIFGGTELNLTQADIQGVATIDITTIFGGAELIVPSHWAVKSEIVTIFGGVEDKRSVSTLTSVPDKALVLKGTIIFGGIEIKSFKK